MHSKLTKRALHRTYTNRSVGRLKVVKHPYKRVVQTAEKGQNVVQLLSAREFK